MSTDSKIQINIPAVIDVEYIFENQYLPEILDELSLRLGFNFERKGDDLIIYAKVLCLNNTNVFISYVTAWTFRLTNIEEVFEFATEGVKDKIGIMPTLINIVVDGVRGQLALKTTDLLCGQIVLPLFNIDDIIKSIRQ